MQLATPTTSMSKTKLWIGRILVALPVLFLLFDSVIHIMEIPPVVESFYQAGYPVALAFGIGMLELACLVVYMLPRTSMLGAVLLTGYLGGAVATNLRIGAPLFSTVLFPVYIGALIWGGLYLRDERVRALFAPRK